MFFIWINDMRGGVFFIIPLNPFIIMEGEVLEYVRNAVSEGKSESQIKARLAVHGVPAEDIISALDLAREKPASPKKEKTRRVSGGKNLLERIDDRLSSISHLTEEDVIDGEEFLYSSKASWYGESLSFLTSTLMFAGSLALLAYLAAAGKTGFRDILIFLPLLGILGSLLVFLMALFTHYSSRFLISNMRVIRRDGLLDKHLAQVPYRNLQNVKVKKRMTQRFVDIGDIHLDVAGGPKVEIVMENLPDPEIPHKLILENMYRVDHKQEKTVEKEESAGKKEFLRQAGGKEKAPEENQDKEGVGGLNKQA